uniref:Uncharacterized protein n=1 Tax=Anguilla anguilla TaxID=7936 RepID=A0A0E9X2A1_ANGAN
MKGICREKTLSPSFAIIFEDCSKCRPKHTHIKGKLGEKNKPKCLTLKRRKLIHVSTLYRVHYIHVTLLHSTFLYFCITSSYCWGDNLLL